MSEERKCGTCAKLDMETCTAIRGEICFDLSCWVWRNDPLIQSLTAQLSLLRHAIQDEMCDCANCDDVRDAKGFTSDKCMKCTTGAVHRALKATANEAQAEVAGRLHELGFLRDLFKEVVEQRNTLTVQLGEARKALGIVLHRLEQNMEFGRVSLTEDSNAVMIGQQALSLTDSSALARYKALEEVAKAAKGLQVMPDCAFEEARDVWGNTNANLYKQRFEAVREALVKLQEVVE
jgi:hypothetical protein